MISLRHWNVWRARAGVIGCLLAAVLIQYFDLGGGISRRVLDYQFNWLQSNRSLQTEVVVIGIDEASFRALPEPYALWHPYLAKVLYGLAEAHPAVVGLDIVLPERSYQSLVPRSDDQLVLGLQALREKVPLVLARTLDEDGRFRKIHEPFVLAAGSEALAPVVNCADEDGVVRYFDPRRCTVGVQGITLVEKMAEHLGRRAAGTGLIDYSVGGMMGYVPFLKVLEWQEQGRQAVLRETFGGKAVLLGVVAHSGERVSVPVPLATWRPLEREVPEVLAQAQALRAIVHGRLIVAVSDAIVMCLMLLAVLFCLVRRGWVRWAVLAAFPWVLLGSATWLLEQGFYLPTGGILLSGFFAFLARLVYESVLRARERRSLRGIFGNYVSQEVLQQIMAGKIRSGLGGVRQRVALLFADIHGFRTCSEGWPPEEVVALLNDYFSEMTIAIHQHNGTVDKFIGDGIMAFFGAPQPLACPEKNALEAAQEMLLRLRWVNTKLHERGLAPIEVGIALHVGEVVIGYIGSASRHEYTIVGDAVSLTPRLEELTGTLGYPVVCSADVAKAVGQAGGLTDCGEHHIKGVPLQVFGWHPPRLAQR